MCYSKSSEPLHVSNIRLGSVAKLSALILLVFMLSGCEGEDEFAWLERQWVSDRETTRVANPHFAKLSKDLQEELLQDYGTFKWRVSDEHITWILETGEELPQRYAIDWSEKQDDVAILDLGLEHGMFHTYYLWRTETGFCVRIAELEFVVTDLMREIYPTDDPLVASDTALSSYEFEDPFVYADCYIPDET